MNSTQRWLHKLVVVAACFLCLSGFASAENSALAAPKTLSMPSNQAAITLSLGNSSKKGKIAIANALAFYNYTAPQTGTYGFTVKFSSSKVRPNLLIKDFAGKVLGENSSGKITLRLNKNQSIRIQVGAQAGKKGSFTLKTVAPSKGTGAVTAVKVTGNKAVFPGKKLKLKSSVVPKNAYKQLTWSSNNPSVVSVSSNGTVTAHKPGTANITATAHNGKAQTVKFTVKSKLIKKITLNKRSQSVSRGSTVKLTAKISPSNVTQKNLTWTSSNNAVASVSSSGVVTAKQAGTATIRATAQDGSKKSASFKITVTPRYNALLIGEWTHPSHRDNYLPMAKNNVQGMRDMLSRSKIQGVKYSVSSYTDNPGKTRIKQLIASKFSGAKSGDISLLYINCHGTEYGEIALPDGTLITPAELESWLRPYQGQFVVIFDMCFSGKFIGKGASPSDAFSTNMINTFRAANAASAKAGNNLAQSKYHVLCSSSQNQFSWNLNFAETRNGRVLYDSYGNPKFIPSKCYGIFTRSFLKGSGWDMLKDKSQSMAADSNKNKVLTISELYNYSARQVQSELNAYRKKNPYDPNVYYGIFYQNVQVYPSNSSLAVVGR